MADISAEIAAFRNAVYGEDVRDAMVSLANKINTESSKASSAISKDAIKLTNVDDLNSLDNGLYYWQPTSLPQNKPSIISDTAFISLFQFGQSAKLQIFAERYTNKIWIRCGNGTTWRDTFLMHTDGVTPAVLDIFNTINSSNDCNNLEDGFYYAKSSSLPLNWPGTVTGLLFNFGNSDAKYQICIVKPNSIFMRIYSSTDAGWYNWYNVSQSIIDLNTYNIIGCDIKHLLNFEIGGLGSTSGAYSSDTKSIRIRRTSLPYDIQIIGLTTKFFFQVYYFSSFDTSSACTSYEVARSKKRHFYTLKIPANTIFDMRIVPENSSDAPTLTDVISSDNYNSVLIIRNSLYGLTLNNLLNEDVINIPFTNDNFMSVAHQGYDPNNSYGNSRISSYIRAAKYGFNWGECDIVFSSDDICMCCHDPSFEDSETSETIVIANHTAEELKTYNYYGETIATLDEVLSVCKKMGLGLQIDHTAIFDDNKWTSIFKSIERYGMRNYVAFTCNSTSIGDIIVSWNSKTNLCIVSSDTNDTSSIIDLANSYKIRYPEANIYLIVPYNIFNYNQIIDLRDQLSYGIKIGVRTVDSYDRWCRYYPLVDEITSNTECYNSLRHLFQNEIY